MGVNKNKMKILLEAPILTQSGYGQHSRVVFNSLRDKGYDIYINPLNWGTTPWTDNTDTEINESIHKFKTYRASIKTKDSNMEFDMQIHVGIFNEFEKKAPYSVCVTAGIETDRVSSNWLLKTHSGVNKIIVPSEHAKSGFINTAYEVHNNQVNERQLLECACPVDVVPYPIKKHTPQEINLELETKFNFLTMALLGPRKNIENLITWFLQEFKDEPDVGLVVKTAFSKGSKIDRTKTVKHLKNIVKQNANSKCSVYLLHGNLKEEEISHLYKDPNINVFVTTTHGEGYGLPIFEAAYSGMPVVATDWSAHLDFLSAPYKESGKVKEKKLFSKVAYNMGEIPKSAVWKDILVEGSKWAYPVEKSFKEQIRKTYKNYGMYKKWSESLQKHILENYEESMVYEKMYLSLIPEELRGSINSADKEIEDIFASLSQISE